MHKEVVLFIAVAALALSAPSHAQIYKTVDAEGNVVFTDVPPKDETSAVKLDAYNTYSEVKPPVEPSVTPIEEDLPAAEEEVVTYDELRITWPQNDEAVRENAGNVSVKVEANPALDPSVGHSVRILVDGTPTADGAANAVALTNVDRGTHSLVAQIVDAQGNVLVASNPVTFHMLRVFVRPKPASGS